MCPSGEILDLVYVHGLFDWKIKAIISEERTDERDMEIQSDHLS
jgi:hypothetical protein